MAEFMSGTRDMKTVLKTSIATFMPAASKFSLIPKCIENCIFPDMQPISLIMFMVMEFKTAKYSIYCAMTQHLCSKDGFAHFCAA